jgi:hypothetical protein
MLNDEGKNSGFNNGFRMGKDVSLTGIEETFHTGGCGL